MKGNFCTSYQYNTLSELIVKLYDLPDTDEWVEVRPGQEDRFISETEAKQIMSQYPIVELYFSASTIMLRNLRISKVLPS